VAATKKEKAVVQAAGREIAISNPGKIYFPETGITKLEVVQ
jgi:DNA primase